SPSPVATLGQGVNALVADGSGNLYYHQSGNASIGRITTGGAGQTTFANTVQSNGLKLSIHPTFLFWTDYTDGSVNLVPLNASTLPANPSHISTGESGPQNPFASAGDIWWTAGDKLLFTGTSPGPLFTLVEGLVAPVEVVVAGAGFVLAAGTAPDHADGYVYRAPNASAPEGVLAKGIRGATSMCTDGDVFYWTQADGTIRMI